MTVLKKSKSLCSEFRPTMDSETFLHVLTVYYTRSTTRTSMADKVSVCFLLLRQSSGRLKILLNVPPKFWLARREPVPLQEFWQRHQCCAVMSYSVHTENALSLCTEFTLEIRTQIWICELGNPTVLKQTNQLPGCPGVLSSFISVTHQVIR